MVAKNNSPIKTWIQNGAAGHYDAIINIKKKHYIDSPALALVKNNRKPSELCIKLVRIELYKP